MTLLLSLLAVVFLVLAAFGVSVRGVSLGWVGLAIWAVVELLA